MGEKLVPRTHKAKQMLIIKVKECQAISFFVVACLPEVVVEKKIVSLQSRSGGENESRMWTNTC